LVKSQYRECSDRLQAKRVVKEANKMIYISEENLRQIKQHGEREYPHECCGLLIGKFNSSGSDKKKVLEILPIENAKEESARHNRSLILPTDLLKGERYAREKGLDVIGNYHSHPDDEARPSQFDLDHALPVWSYVIASIRQGKAADARSWVMENDRSKFEQEEIIQEG
jgi:proteasome lid subunit RPN8/RPN11